MCGIAGIARSDRQRIDSGPLIRMRDAMHYRGPDDSGLYISSDGSVALAHRRLSILDLSSLAHQPMSSEDGNVLLVYNGEIYNFRELKADLKATGHTFFSDSDSEVIIKAYQEWGEEGFKRLNGMFAFSIYDKRKGLLYLVRDHAGIKPLYYSMPDKRLVFASEVKAFSTLDSTWEENSDWRIYFLIFGHLPEPFTTLKDVHMLPKGNFLRFDITTGAHEIRSFHRLVFAEKISDRQEAIERIRDVFTNAVKRHLISDAPIGVFLSGGIDSSLIALIAHKFQNDNLRTLSVVFNEKEFSEENYQNIVLNTIRSRHHSCLVAEQDFVNNLDEIFDSMDQPSIDGVNTYFISKCAKEAGLKSVLSGVGGDELFGGYPSFTRINHLWKTKKIPENIRGLFKLSEFSGNNKHKRLSFLSLPEPLSFYLLLRGLFTPQAVSEITGCSVADVYRALEKIDVRVNEQLGKQNMASWLETDLYMKNQLLKDTDFMGMRHSVEVRVPFLDRELMETIFSIKENIKFKKDVPKSLLMDSFRDILPEEIISRKKQGFTFPFDMWIRKNGKRFFEEAIAGSTLNKDYAEKLWSRFEKGNLHWSRLWGCVILAGCPVYNRQAPAPGGN